MCSAIQPSCRACQEAMRSAWHFLPRSALPPYPEPTLQMSRSSGKCSDEAAVGREVAERVHAGDEVLGVAHVLERDLSDPRHHVHAGDDVGAVGDHHADAAHRRAGRPHQVGDHVHRAPAHRAAEEAAHALLGLCRRHPVVGGPGIVAGAGADEGELLGAGHVARMAPVQVAVRIGARVRAASSVPSREHLLDQPVVLGLGAVAPRRRGPGGEVAALVHPLLDELVGAIRAFLGVLRAMCQRTSAFRMPMQEKP